MKVSSLFALLVVACVLASSGCVKQAQEQMASDWPSVSDSSFNHGVYEVRVWGTPEGTPGERVWVEAPAETKPHPLTERNLKACCEHIVSEAKKLGYYRVNLRFVSSSEAPQVPEVITWIVADELKRQGMIVFQSFQYSQTPPAFDAQFAGPGITMGK